MAVAAPRTMAAERRRFAAAASPPTVDVAKTLILRGRGALASVLQFGSRAGAAPTNNLIRRTR
jgi:hypothetical protein